MSWSRARAAAALATAVLALGACKARDDDAHAAAMARRIERLEDSLQRLATDAAALRSQLDDLRRERDAQRAAAASMSPMPSPPTSPPASAPGTPPGAPSGDAAPTVPPPPTAAVVTLSVQSVPTGARVYVDGTLVGTTPLISTRPASAPAAVVRISKPGFRTHSATLEAGQPAQLRVKLIAR